MVTLPSGISHYLVPPNLYRQTQSSPLLTTLLFRQMPYPVSVPGQVSNLARPIYNPTRRTDYPGLPIYLEAHEEESTDTEVRSHKPTVPSPPNALWFRGPECSASIQTTDRIGYTHLTTTQTLRGQSTRTSFQKSSSHLPQRPSYRSSPFYPSTRRHGVYLSNRPSSEITQDCGETKNSVDKNGLGISKSLPPPPSAEILAPKNERPDSSTNFAQRVEERLWQYSASGNILKRWLIEVISWIFSMICMAVLVGLLVQFKDTPISSWTLDEKTGVTLNTCISVLSKMSGAALILPVSEALGQLKWIWFLEHSQQMWDFEIFDNASRGPWGSMLLLIRTKGKALAALGAMIMLCSLALDPFFQQVVHFPDQWTLQEALSTIPKVVYYQPPPMIEYKLGYETSPLDRSLSPVVQEFFYGNGTQPVQSGNATRPEIPLTCPTSYCTWPEYKTLGICSECVSMNSSEIVAFACLDTAIDWSANTTGPINTGNYPNGTVCGYFINATSDEPMLMSGYSIQSPNASSIDNEALLVRVLPLTEFLTKKQLFGSGSINFKHIRNPILDALIVSASDGVESVYRNEAPIIHECVLSWCIQNINSSYDQGHYNEEIIHVFENTTAGPPPWESFDISDENGPATFILYTQNITIEPDHSNDSSLNITSYGTSNTSAVNVMSIFDDFFPSYYSKSPSTKPTLRFKNYADGATFRELAFNPWQAPNNVTRHMERLALAMTNVMRSSISGQMVKGSTYKRETYIIVRWVWLTLPLGLLLTSFVFLAATVAKSALERDRVGVWKTSAYATLLYGLPDDMQRNITRSASSGTPRAKAKEMKVKLQPNYGWRISESVRSPWAPKPPLNQAPPGWI